MNPNGMNDPYEGVTVTPPTTPGADLEALSDFINHLKAKGVRSFKGDVPVSNGESCQIEIVFERPTKHIDDGE